MWDSSEHKWIDVNARNTSFGFKGRTVDVRILGQQTNADYVVEGGVQRAMNRVRINTHLMDNKTPACLGRMI